MSGRDLAQLMAHEAIRQTLAAYTMAGDGRRPAEFAATFARDAIFRSAVFDLRGRHAIHAWFAERAVKAATGPLVRHNLGTCLIQLDGDDAADVQTYFTVFSDAGPDHGGRYVDRFARAGAQWLIAQRDVRLEWAQAGSLLVPPAARAAFTDGGA